MKRIDYFAIIITISLFSLVSCQQKSVPTVTSTGEPMEITKLSSSKVQSNFSPDGKSVVITDYENDQIKIVNRENGSESIIDASVSADTDVRFSESGNSVYFVTSDFEDRIRKSDLILKNLSDQTSKKLLEGSRNLKLMDSNLNGKYITAMEDNKVKVFDATSGDEVQEANKLVAVQVDSDLNLVVYRNQQIKKINPKGDANYLWASISPAKDKILFAVAGKGSFISDLDGGNLVELGRLHTPSWSADGKWVIGMDDQDDGVNFTSSDIIMVSSDGQTRKNLTEDKEIIALNPRLSPDGESVIFNNEAGNIYTMKLK